MSETLNVPSAAAVAGAAPCYALFRDGAAWCAVGKEFVNLQESPAGFGETPLAALGALIVEEGEIEMCRCEGMRRWKCNNCQTTFERGRIAVGAAPACPRCKAGAQYVYEHNDKLKNAGPRTPDVRES